MIHPVVQADSLICLANDRLTSNLSIREKEVLELALMVVERVD